MLQVIISLFLVINVSNAFDEPKKQRTVSEGQNRSSRNLSAGITTTKGLIQGKHFVADYCHKELGEINYLGRYLQEHSMGMVRNNRSAIDKSNNMAEFHLDKCLKNVKTEIGKIPHPISKESWYNQYLAERKYEKDFEHYPELKGQFKEEMDRASQQLGHVASAQGTDISKYIRFYIDNHPHLKENHSRPEDTLPGRYNAMLIELRKQKTCNPEKTEELF